MVQKWEGDIWTYITIVDVPEPTVMKVIDPEIPFMYGIHMYLLRHFWLTQTKRLNLNIIYPYTYEQTSPI